MANIKVLLYKSKRKKDGSIPLVLRIIKDRKPKYIFLKQNIFEKDWDEVKYRVKKSHPSYRRINNLIVKKISEADDLILELETTNQDISADQIKNKIKRGKQSRSFLKYADTFLENLKSSKKFKQHSSDKSRIKLLKEFSNGDLNFDDITVAFLNKFKVYLMATGNRGERTTMNYLATIRTIYKKAISEGYTDKSKDPFGDGGVSIKIPESLKVGLERKEIKKIIKLELEKDTTIWHTKNVFLVSYYFAGMRISDVLKLKWIDIQNDRLIYQMDKNGKIGSILAVPEVIEILNFYTKYKSNKNDFIFPFLKKANLKDSEDIYRKDKNAVRILNKKLKDIADMVGIEKNISNHISRHSFATIAGGDIPLQTLKELYRHSNISTTVGYQRAFMNKETDEALQKVLSE